MEEGREEEDTYTVGIILHLISAKDDERKGLE